ncbi:uncharacterized protein LOC109823190 [Asparagus officinalis]|uniref:uncharacterized protein LOC109823190 n=1 Tax=Asparagus officinalis TaxID=4686 RepID=UPI00098E29E7|nr:uncharacterized protein LOC109823190 [Asparagus officinalis]
MVSVLHSISLLGKLLVRRLQMPLRNFFTFGKLLGAINATSISLVPKVNCPKSPSDFRPISCCNCIYKFISKILASKIKLVLGCLINEAQSAFVKGRQISNNILLAHELVKNYGRKSISPRTMLNIDIKKAFDTISWSFLEDMLIGLGFPNKMITWIMACVTSPRYSISLNGILYGYFKGERGLRQDDPLSPYLFILGMEYLSRSLDKLKHDSSYNAVSGLEANQSKCSIYFGGMDATVKASIQNFLGVSEGALPIRTDQVLRPPLVAWDKVCTGKIYGGLGIFSATGWNMAAVLKTLWSIHENKESMWIKWVHGNYIKNGDVWNVESKRNDSWLWRQILKIRNKAISECGGIDNLKSLISSCYKNSKIHISGLYNALSLVSTKVLWHDTVWENWNYPKHNFVFWLAIQNKLLTQDKLQSRGIILCVLVGNPKQASYSRQTSKQRYYSIKLLQPMFRCFLLKTNFKAEVLFHQIAAAYVQVPIWKIEIISFSPVLSLK